MAHTITITRLAGDQYDDADYEVGGTCDSWCEVWALCEDENCRRRVVSEAEKDAGEAVWHEVEHRYLFEFGWCVRTGECGKTYAYDIGMEAQMVESLGTYMLGIEWDGDDWCATIGPLVTESRDSDGPLSSCICDGGAYGPQRYPFIRNVQCVVHGVASPDLETGEQ